MSRPDRRAPAWRAAVVLVLAAALLLWLFGADLTRRRAPDSNPRPTPELLDRGEYLARAGNCIACHTVPGGAPYSGGRRISTPFGDVFSTNLTPDVETGLGAWTAADFWSAMHEGRARDGRLLYPAFPYPNYTMVTREDSDAIFSYLRSLPAASKQRPAPELRFPYNTQLALRVWQRLYFRPAGFQPDAGLSARENRGRYLVEGLGHCGACHTARTLLGGSREESSYAGGPIPTLGWDALPLVPARPMDEEDAKLLRELLGGGTSRTGVTSGPMAEVVYHSLQYLKPEDIDAMIGYLAKLPPSVPPVTRNIRVGEKQRKQLMEAGLQVYGDHCADCHGDHGEGKPYVYPALVGNSSVLAASPNNAIRSVLYGGYAPSTAANPRPYGMPPFAHRLSADEVAAVLSYIRGSWGNGAPAVSPQAVDRR